MKVYLFGNIDSDVDNRTYNIARKINKDFPEVVFENIKPNQDLPFVDEEQVYIMDAVMGIPKPVVLTNKDIAKLILPPRSTAHDYDLAFQLKYLLKLGKLKKVIIIGIPTEGDVDYSSTQSIFRKLVAHDIQGS